ncbi:SH3 domain-containing protein [Pontibacter pamirensis]|uniref:SH3 domain-containing protein n=1 Tax=Pontibacter pamirensis TaxID=2562824 RepID=UPI0037426C23
MYAVKADLLNVRSGPGSNYIIVGKVTRGEILTGIQQSSSWVKISYTALENGSVNNKTGYVSRKYLSILQ